MSDIAIFDKLTAHWESKQQLSGETTRDGHVHFHPSQNVSRFKELALDIVRQTNNNLIICAFDSVGYDYFAQAFGKHVCRIVPVTSTIPSTSMSAWTSIFRGTVPAVHGIYGTAFYIPEFGNTVSFLSHSLDQDHIEAGCSKFSWLSKDAGATLFKSVSELGYSCSFYGLGTDLAKLSFFNQIAEGSQIIEIPDSDRLEYDLKEYVKYLLSIIEKVTSGKDPFCDVAFLSCARYVADYGYDKHVTEALAFFARKINSIKRRLQNVSILAIADHGMIKQKPLLDIPLISDPSILELSKYKPGGAGRILFFYPKEENFSSMWSLLQTKINKSGKLYSREQYIQQYYNCAVYQQERIGEIIAIAENEQFPSAGLHDIYEHGALTQDEMLSFISLI